MAQEVHKSPSAVTARAAVVGWQQGTMHSHTVDYTAYGNPCNTMEKSHDSHMTDLCYRVQQLLHCILCQLAEGGLEVLWDNGVGGGKTLQIATERQHVGEPEHSTTNCRVKGVQGRQQSEGTERTLIWSMIISFQPLLTSCMVA